MGTGNNGNLVKGLLRRRYWWCIIEDKNYRANFIWTQIKNVDYFKNQPSAESLSARKCCKTEKEGRKDIQKTQDENGVSKQLRRNKNLEKIMNS